MVFANPMNPNADYEKRLSEKQAETIVTLGWVVSDVNHGDKKLRLKRNEGGEEIKTGWLRMPSLSTNKIKLWMPIQLGQNVALLSPYGNFNLGVVITQFWTEQNQPPVTDPKKVHIEFEDKSIIEYDAAEGKLTIELKGGSKEMEIKASGGKITIDAPETEIKGKLKVTDTIEATGNISSAGNVQDAVGTLANMRGTYNIHTHALGTGVTLIPNNPVSG